MKITLVNTYDITGGAARAMYRLHQGLRKIGQDSHILSRYKQSNDESVELVDPSINLNGSQEYTRNLSTLIQDCISTNRSSLSNTLFSFPYPDWDIVDQPRIQDSDIINLHWVSYFQSARSITKLLETGKTLVWTLHDEWPLTGGCHYTAGCEGFTKDCKNCPQLSIPNSGIPPFVLEEKKQSFLDRIAIISPSKWLAEQAKKSNIFHNSRIEVIPNSLDTSVFVPTSKDIAKAKWNIASDTFTMLFGAENGNEKRKGFPELLQALGILEEKPKWKSEIQAGRIQILLFGEPALEIKNLGIPYTSLGITTDDNTLALAYSAADLFVLPSIEDNLPNTMLESLACETPIVAFRAGGIPDMVIPGKTGWLADFAKPASLAEKIWEAFENSQSRRAMGKQGRTWMEEEFTLEVQASRYTKLFEELIEKKKSKPVSKANLNSLKKDFQIPESVEEEVFLNSRRILLNTYSHFKKIENYESSQAQFFFADNGAYDFTKGFQTTIPTSTSLCRFYIHASVKKVVDLRKNLPHVINKTTGILILPSMRNPFVISISKIFLLLETGEKKEFLLEQLKGNWTDHTDNTYYFYHGHGEFQITFNIECVTAVELIGQWRALNPWEAYQGMNSIIEGKNSQLNSRVNRISMKIGNALANPLRWLLGKRRVNSDK